MKFSERIAKRPIRQSMQLESIDDDLKHKLWNIIYIIFLSDLSYSFPDLLDLKKTMFNATWHRFYKRPIDTIPYKCSDIVDTIRKWFYKAEWFDIYDFIEFLEDFSIKNKSESIASPVNAILEEEIAGYRLINGQITPITDEHELREIENAIENSKKNGLKVVTDHLDSALDKIADRKNPDYRNSIKESISAVEAIAKMIANSPKVELGDALKLIEQKVSIHPALKKAFLSMYGYTSDGDGIRHALTEQSSCEFEDAKFMLVTCSAFINYLIVKSQKAGVKLKYDGA